MLNLPSDGENMALLTPIFEGLEFRVSDGVTGSSSVGMILKASTSGADIGIGTTNPTAKLHVEGGIFKVTTASGDDVFIADPDQGIFSLGDTGGLADTAFITGDGSVIQIKNDGAVTLTSNSNNRVGIGTDSPSEKLEVDGNIRLSSDSTIYSQGDFLTLMAGGTGGTAITIDDTAGHVGILNSSPSYNLDVAGTGNFDNSVKAGSFRVSSLNTAPANDNSPGTVGEIRFTSDYIYLCVAANSWKRVSIADWTV
jgi:hypothetical protein